MGKKSKNDSSSKQAAKSKPKKSPIGFIDLGIALGFGMFFTTLAIVEFSVTSYVSHAPSSESFAFLNHYYAWKTNAPVLSHINVFIALVILPLSLFMSIKAGLVELFTTDAPPVRAALDFFDMCCLLTVVALQLGWGVPLEQQFKTQVHENGGDIKTLGSTTSQLYWINAVALLLNVVMFWLPIIKYNLKENKAVVEVKKVEQVKSEPKQEAKQENKQEPKENKQESKKGNKKETKKTK
eukprot:TRINITY_DN3999_c0_g2_i2.p1 TRINITY_DN3999_c0_g2~~TRINITY_DN3999_c0_g2_i2.p1  ORF type:complete len:239 (-),score=79.62 TRINITY_DN3999_c0_g2_i2:64-780(-)